MDPFDAFKPDGTSIAMTFAPFRRDKFIQSMASAKEPVGGLFKPDPNKPSIITSSLDISLGSGSDLSFTTPNSPQKSAIFFDSPETSLIEYIFVLFPAIALRIATPYASPPLLPGPAIEITRFTFFKFSTTLKILDAARIISNTS